MKRVINGKVYDTKTAEVIHSISDGYAGDFRAYAETLYRTKKGAWFLRGEGGPMTRWATGHSDGSLSGGEGVVPMTDHEALQWCERAEIDADAAYELFGLEEA